MLSPQVPPQLALFGGATVDCGLAVYGQPVEYGNGIGLGNQHFARQWIDTNIQHGIGGTTLKETFSRSHEHSLFSIVHLSDLRGGWRGSREMG